ncbi:MAG: hypothetical protein ABEH88_12055 [Halobacteriales archaeon]
MSTAGPTRNTPREIDEPPDFKLSHRFDDPDDPSEITVFPDVEEGSTTQWLSIETGYALPLEEIR